MKLKFEPNMDGTKMFVRNEKNIGLGEIYFNKSWKCYVWEQYRNIIMSYDCLLQIENQLLIADARYKNKLKLLKKVKIK
jgi:hypothetical protein